MSPVPLPGVSYFGKSFSPGTVNSRPDRPLLSIMLPHIHPSVTRQSVHSLIPFPSCVLPPVLPLHSLHFHTYPFPCVPLFPSLSLPFHHSLPFLPPPTPFHSLSIMCPALLSSHLPVPAALVTSVPSIPSFLARTFYTYRHKYSTYPLFMSAENSEKYSSRTTTH